MKPQSVRLTYSSARWACCLQVCSTDSVTAWVAKAPDFRLNYTAGKFALTIYAESKADTTLLINLPDGKWVADDDSGGNLNPLVKFDKPQSGQYDIWVGTFGKENAPAVLKITELK